MGYLCNFLLSEKIKKPRYMINDFSKALGFVALSTITMIVFGCSFFFAIFVIKNFVEALGI